MHRRKRYKRASGAQFLHCSTSQPQRREWSPEIVFATDSEDDEDNPENSIIEVESPNPKRLQPRRVVDQVESPEIPRQSLRPRRVLDQIESASTSRSSRFRSVADQLEFGDQNPEISISQVQSPVKRKLVRSTKTVQKQLESYAQQIELEVVICHIWNGEDLTQVLVKDSEEFMSLLVFSTRRSDELLQCLATGLFFRFKGLTHLQTVTTKIWMPLFSVLATFGCQQRFYYKLLVSNEAKWDVLQCLDIAFTGILGCPSPTLLQLAQVPKNEDCRVTIIGKLRAESRWKFHLTDDESEFDIESKMKVTVLPSFESNSLSRIDFEQPVKLHFLRYFRGLATIDQFSSIEQA